MGEAIIARQLLWGGIAKASVVTSSLTARMCPVRLLSMFARGTSWSTRASRLELVGQVEMINDKSSSYEFFSITKDLDPPGTAFETKQYKWKFGNVDKQNETYSGIKTKLRYFVRLVVARGYAGSVTR